MSKEINMVFLLLKLIRLPKLWWPLWRFFFFNKIAIQGTPQMAVDKEAISLSRVYLNTILSVPAVILCVTRLN